jgi:hypothetical protein
MRFCIRQAAHKIGVQMSFSILSKKNQILAPLLYLQIVDTIFSEEMLIEMWSTKTICCQFLYNVTIKIPLHCERYEIHIIL